MNNDDELNNGNGRENGGQSRNPINKLQHVQDTAEGISKGAGKASEVLKKSSEKHAQKAATQTGRKAATSTAKSAKRLQQAQKMATTAKNAQKVAATVAKLGKILAMIGWILLLIIIIIGLLVFILTGLGLIMSGLKEIAAGFRKALISLAVGSEQYVEEKEIADTLSYLQEMNYDLYGYGFSGLPNPLTQETDADGNVTKTELTYHNNIIGMQDESHVVAYRNIKA